MTRRMLRALLLAPVAVVLLVALFGPLLADHDPGRVVAVPYALRGDALPLGADGSGRDVWVRFLCGGRDLVLLPLLGTLLTLVLGTAVGLVSGYLGGPLDAVLSRLSSLFLVVPPILLLLILLHGWGYSGPTLVVAVLVTGVPFVSRMARTATLTVVRSGYVEQAVALGDGPITVMVREVLPNIARPILADAGSRFAIAIFITASAGFLGFGPGDANWGSMISENIEGVGLSPWGVVVPALALSCLTVSANLVLDRLTARIPS
ncbi:peptide/nickel transport system permease protein [Streptomyces sp. 1114.5]|uniref:ABC transporter permease n=1 Tax=unclassified Streptomyces TaxID=2593676 RepID=UPI000BD485A8|nr:MULTISPECIES: ABC transporter permease subunit [unclassified Streptomyces]RKT17045.1 peptide/nickel transport system permease protein [Streptomyces sp. 1114.5]SOB83256.1 peptide/nickel transport system permease protein [Streptomyces sp. 1331.2]